MRLYYIVAQSKCVVADASRNGYGTEVSLSMSFVGPKLAKIKALTCLHSGF